MAKAPKWNQFHTRVDPMKNRFNFFEKNFRHLGTLDSVQVKDEIDISPACDDAIEDYIAEIRKRAEGMTEATITQTSYVQSEDEYDSYAETEVTITGWRTVLTAPEKAAVKEYFERHSLV